MIIIFGAGGHARMLVDSLHALGEQRPVAILDPTRALHGTTVIDAPIVGGDDLLPELMTRGATYFAIGVGGPVSGDLSLRRRLFETAVERGLIPFAIIHPRSIVSPAASLGAGVQVMPGAIVGAGSRIGANTIVNSGAIVEHDCIVGDHVHIASGACLAGAVSVGDGAHIGSGAVVRQVVTIGAGAVVGIGAAVVRDVEPASVVAGVPARVMRSP